MTPTDFEISSSGPRGVAFIRTGVLHELAALNKVELVCQDEWDIAEGEEQLQLVDQLAYRTFHADTALHELRAVFEQGTTLPVPATVKRYA